MDIICQRRLFQRCDCNVGLNLRMDTRYMTVICTVNCLMTLHLMRRNFFKLNDSAIRQLVIINNNRMAGLCNHVK